jgi:hypothetical protein
MGDDDGDDGSSVAVIRDAIGTGGVKDLSPVSYNRRATVKLAD